MHFIDLICGWRNTQLEEVDTRGLSTEWFESKRLGFYEIEGTLLMRFADGSRLKLGCYRHDEEFRAKLELAKINGLLTKARELPSLTMADVLRLQ